MIAYFDTSAVMPLIVSEAGSDEALRGYDSVHLAAAELARGNGGELVFVAGDDGLCRAAEAVGFEVVRTS